ncbi:hypothetical protein TTHERM_001558026 (macronuclear) [Tetrahymena thermophila SB210]|uniref:Uncharacterized protein n=1 Tax=Tetrahymena thermophila (strain SB210) TaxID=312017 RepID=W7XKD5_TETTS|nr:hypothetical protein TTHERM_001558026 [Tetrahymena thermophila SB210]EWS76436.1 hypothetical protein TTHERM_001558026 [Tetrahymena thermophila SB210]|eukprot:XP_012651028.1 hypothetical protein TTHERM_001558026 [Tetrahymena thermophila SB210]
MIHSQSQNFYNKSNKSYLINSSSFFVLRSFLQFKISQSKTNKLFLLKVMSNLIDQYNLLNQNLSVMHPLHEFKKKYIINQLIRRQKYEIIRLINQQQKQKLKIK